jgi:hypothetical protein
MLPLEWFTENNSEIAIRQGASDESRKDWIANPSCCMGYIFFRSSALAHVTAPSHYLQPGTTHRFADTCIAVEITQAHAEGVLEVACFVEYLPQ